LFNYGEQKMIVIIDYGMGNQRSILNMLYKVGGQAIISSDLDEILRAEKLILPGVGAFDHGIQQLANLGLTDLLNRRVIVDKIPILGICLGVQLFTRRSEEGKLAGLGWIDADTIRFKIPSDSKLKVPHMGWNELHLLQDSKLFKGMYPNPRFYFVHSYHISDSCSTEQVIGTTIYGYEFAAVVQKDNIFGTQFHPEKSHKFGMCLFKNFVELI